MIFFQSRFSDKSLFCLAQGTGGDLSKDGGRYRLADGVRGGAKMEPLSTTVCRLDVLHKIAVQATRTILSCSSFVLFRCLPTTPGSRSHSRLTKQQHINEELLPIALSRLLKACAPLVFALRMIHSQLRCFQRCLSWLVHRSIDGTK